MTKRFTVGSLLASVLKGQMNRKDVRIAEVRIHPYAYHQILADLDGLLRPDLYCRECLCERGDDDQHAYVGKLAGAKIILDPRISWGDREDVSDQYVYVDYNDGIGVIYGPYIVDFPKVD